jgi:CheY-like chemotaxis protein
MSMPEQLHRILIAEDNEVTSSVLKFNLERGGFAVRVARDGQEALDFLAEESVNLIITDYQMPRLNGLELIQRLRQAQPPDPTPIFLCSAKGLELDLEMFREKYQIEEVFFKPFSPKAIMAATLKLFSLESATV